MSNEQFLSLAMQTILDNTTDMIFFKDTDLVYRGGSLPFAKMTGAGTIDEVIGKTDFEIMPLELAYQYTADDKELLKSKTPIINKIEPITNLNGKKRYNSTSKYLIKDDNGVVVGLCGVSRDATSQIVLLEENEQREQAALLFKDVLEADITENLMLRVQGQAIAASSSVAECTEFTQVIENIVENNIHPKFREEFKSFFTLSNLFYEYSEGRGHFSHTFLQTLNGTDYRWVSVSSRLYFSNVAGSIKLAMFFADIDDEHRTREQLRKTAQTDALTGLLNRKSTIEKISKCLSDTSSRHALLFIDLDNFKNINDNFGHSAGDKVLVETALQLKKSFRKDDIIGRIGGDEFLVLLKNVSCEQDACKIAKEFFTTLQIRIDEFPNTLAECSIGIALYQADGKTFDKLYAEADNAMYCAKREGRGKTGCRLRVSG